jgi:sugar lactone lactonase YvrE
MGGSIAAGQAPQEQTSYTLVHSVSTAAPLPLPLAALVPVGRDLHRPECVVPTRAGHVLVSDWRGGVTALCADGTIRTWLAGPGSPPLRPNGVAPTADGAFLLAHLGDTGGVWRLDRDGTATPWLIEVDGVALPPTNFVTTDERARTWISVSTRHQPRQRAWRPDVADGFVVLADAHGARIVADGLHYTNEVRPDPSGRWLFVIETFGRRVTRFPILARGELGRAETVITLGAGCFPDGFAFDEQGGLWITSIVSNRVLWLHGDRLDTVVEEAHGPFVEEADAAFTGGRMHAEHLGPIPGSRLQHVTSIAFGGPDRRTAYLGSLHATSIHRFRAPVAGAVPPHWELRAPR